MTGSMPIRVTVLDTWDTFSLALPATTPISEVKQQALAQARVAQPADAYLVKYLGAEVPEAATTLASAGVVANAALIVLPRHRTPVR